MMFHYDGDEPEGRILAWFKLQLKAIGTLWDAELPEHVLMIVYSGIDSFGLLAASLGVPDASEKTFTKWCDEYLLTRLQSVDSTPVTSVDLYAARCGVLHTSTPLSKKERQGHARQVFYQFKGKIALNTILNAPQIPVLIDIENLALAFMEGGSAFLEHLKNDPGDLNAAEERARHFFTWVGR